MAIVAVPIQPVQTLSGNQWRANRLIEEATQTFKVGTPICITTGDGGVKAWAGALGVNGTITQDSICGISYEGGSNLASTGLGAPSAMSPLTGLGATLSFGSVPNEASAKNIPHGAPFNDGRVGFYLANPDTIFSAMFGNAGAVATPAATDVGLWYGMTVDTAGNFWYVDKSKATQATNTCVKIVALDPRVAPGAGTLVFFQFDSRFVNMLG